MKLPAMAIAVSFTGGVILGLCPPLADRAASARFLTAAFAGTCFLILAGIWFARAQHMLLAAASSVLSWIALGVLGAGISSQPLPSDHVVMLADTGRINLHMPLRWHGKLRDEPARLPWGYGYEIELEGVENQGALLPARGGLRLTFTPHPGDQALPELHAGDQIAFLAHAKRPQVFRDDGAFNRRAYLAMQNIDLVATLRASELIERVSRSRPTPAALLARSRRRLREETDTLFSANPPVAGVLRAMLLGDRSFLDRDEITDFQKTGVFHVLVVAGLHVGALAAFLFWAGRKLRLSRLLTIVFSLMLLLAYVAVVEQRPPVLRAALMATIVALGTFFYRRLDLLNSAAIAALLLMIARPLAVRDSSFQLTFAAIGCIAGLALPWLARTTQPYVRALRGWRDVTRDTAHEPRAAQFRIDLRATARWMSARSPSKLARTIENALAGGLSLFFRTWELLVLTIVLQVGMLPLMASDFHRITIAAPLVNLAVVPLTGALVPMGFFVLGIGILSLALGHFAAVPLSWLALALIHVVQWFAKFPRLSYRIPGPPLCLLVFFFVLAISLAATMRITAPWRRAVGMAICVGVAGCSIAIALFPFSPHWSPGKLELTVLDVGQGDSLFVVSPHGKTLLIDGGGAFGGFPGHDEHIGVDPGEEAVSPYLWSRGFQKLDFVALTHAHQDHVGGLNAVLENFRVGTVWIGREVASPALAKFEGLARVKGIPIEHEIRGKTFLWDGVEGQFFWPEILPTEIGPSAKNNDSLVLRLRYGNRTLLLPGDAEKEAERAILSENAETELQADILKVGHHGGQNSTIPEFLAAVKPRVAIISAGEDNSYGQPSPRLTERLDSAHVRILRTDRDGAVHIWTDGHSLEIACFVACPEAAGESSRVAQTPDQEKKPQQQ